MDTIAEVRARLIKYPNTRTEEGPNFITVLPMDNQGFPVSVHVADGDFVVSFAGWHEHFSSAELALNCFAFGLSEDCRLKVHKRGDIAYRWTVESRQNTGWVVDSTTGLLFFPFWRRRDVAYLQNRLLPANSSFDADALRRST